MEDEKQVVNPEESTPSEETAVEQNADDTAAEPAAQETTEQAEQAEEVDDRGVPWKNVAMEWQRKHNDLTDRLPQLVSEQLEAQFQKHQPQQQTPQYTVAQLEQLALEKPEYRPWVEEQKAKLIQENLLKTTEARIKEAEQKQRAESVRNEAFKWVTNHPRLQECLTVDAMGRKIFNPQHPLTQMISGYMNERDLASRPDALVVASKLALADYLDMQNTSTQKKNKVLQQTLKKVQKQTLVEGGGVRPQQTRTAFQKAQDRLRASGKLSDAKDAVAQYLRNAGVLED